MNKSIRMNSQGGFTMIELIVVIVILGILAATALPRFTNMSGEARLASLNAARGALVSTAAMTHGRWLISPTATQLVEGATVTMTNGYPGVVNATTSAPSVVNTGLMLAAGLDADYQVISANATSMRVVPRNIVGTPNATTCYLTYNEGTAIAPPVVVVTGTADACD